MTFLYTLQFLILCGTGFEVLTVAVIHCVFWVTTYGLVDSYERSGEPLWFCLPRPFEDTGSMPSPNPQYPQISLQSPIILKTKHLKLYKSPTKPRAYYPTSLQGANTTATNTRMAAFSYMCHVQHACGTNRRQAEGTICQAHQVYQIQPPPHQLMHIQQGNEYSPHTKLSPLYGWPK